MRSMIVKDGRAVDAVKLPPDWTGAEGEWQPLTNTEAVPSDSALIGDVYDGETFTTPEPPPPDYSANDWFRMIQSRADTEINAGITVTVDGVDYRVSTTASARTLIAGAKIRAEEAIAAGTSITRKVPTDKGVVTFDRDGLLAIFEAAEAHQQAVVSRVEELEAMVRDGTITDADLEGWP